MPIILSEETIAEIVETDKIPGMRRDQIDEIPWLTTFLEDIQDSSNTKISGTRLKNIIEKKEASGTLRSWRNNVSSHVTQFITFVLDYCATSI
jgi:hypothetical protein